MIFANIHEHHVQKKGIHKRFEKMLSILLILLVTKPTYKVLNGTGERTSIK